MSSRSPRVLILILIVTDLYRYKTSMDNLYTVNRSHNEQESFSKTAVKGTVSQD
jgi:hypothetical protein